MRRVLFLLPTDYEPRSWACASPSRRTGRNVVSFLNLRAIGQQKSVLRLMCLSMRRSGSFGVEKSLSFTGGLNHDE
jgi:hypothetical protein